MLGWECNMRDEPISQLDPKLSAVCQGFICTDGICQSCRTAMDCCLDFQDSVYWSAERLGVDAGAHPGFEDCEATQGGDHLCIWFSRVGANICQTGEDLARVGLVPP
jgi:hypothetical protein